MPGPRGDVTGPECVQAIMSASGICKTRVSCLAILPCLDYCATMPDMGNLCSLFCITEDVATDDNDALHSYSIIMSKATQ